MSNTSKEDWEFCQQHQELSDLLVEHGCAPAGEDRGLLRALVARSEEDQAARVVPCEIDGNIMYAGGVIAKRGKQIDIVDGEPIYEWLVQPPAEPA